MQPAPPDQTGTRPVRLYWYAGPPFTSNLLLPAATRAGGETVPLLEAGAANDLDSAAARIAARVRAGGDPTQAVLIAHGLAVPAVSRAAALLGPATLAGMVLSNGPITRLDPVTAGWVRVAGAIPAIPKTLFARWLASSAGLRRAVANPYVMDRDTIAAICTPAFETVAHRSAVSAYLRSLAHLPPFVPSGVPTLLAWGDDDPLYPLAEADAADVLLGGGRVQPIPGGRFGHPEERPWALADLVTAFCVGPGARGTR